MTHYLNGMRRAAILEDRSILTLTGADARDFLQGLVTADMAQCVPGHALYTALLTPQGKILYEFFMAQADEERFLVDCAAPRAADLVKRLGLYKLRAKVTMAPSSDSVAAVWDGNALAARDGILGVKIGRAHV